MPSRKQLLYCQFLQLGILRLRVLCGVAEGCSAPDLLGMREAFADGFEEANLLHHVHCSVLDPEYVENDVSFINSGFRVHSERLGDRLSAETAALMVAFYEGVPEGLRPQLEWHPSAELRALAAQRHVEPNAAPDPACA
jgi:hypothetical protein